MPLFHYVIFFIFIFIDYFIWAIDYFADFSWAAFHFLYFRLRLFSYFSLRWLYDAHISPLIISIFSMNYFRLFHFDISLFDMADIADYYSLMYYCLLSFHFRLLIILHHCYFFFHFDWWLFISSFHFSHYFDCFFHWLFRILLIIADFLHFLDDIIFIISFHFISW